MDHNLVGEKMNLKFWEKKKVLGPGELLSMAREANSKAKADRDAGKGRQRAKRKGLSRRDWEKANGRKWVNV